MVKKINKLYMYYAFCGKHHLITPINNKCYQYVQYQYVQNVYVLQYFFHKVVVQEEDFLYYGITKITKITK